MSGGEPAGGRKWWCSAAGWKSGCAPGGMLPGLSYRSGDPLGEPGRDSDHSLLLLSPGRSASMSPRRPERSLSSVEPTPESLASASGEKSEFKINHLYYHGNILLERLHQAHWIKFIFF